MPMQETPLNAGLHGTSVLSGPFRALEIAASELLVASRSGANLLCSRV